MTKATHIVGLDLGTSQVTVVVGQIGPTGSLEILGLGQAPARGLRKGVVVNPDAAVEPIRRAVEDAERISGLDIESVYVSMSGTLLRGSNHRGVIAIAGRDRRITAADIQRVIDAACLVTLPGGHEIVDMQPQEYLIDGQDGITDPLGMLGSRLEALVHLITGPATIRQNVVTAVNKAGLYVAGVVSEPIAAAEAVLTADEREYGSVAINIGSETTSLAVYKRGAVQHTAIFPLGGAHFTSDIAIGVRTPIPEAERIKREFGCVLSNISAGHAGATIPVPSFNQRPSRSLSVEVLCDILQARAEEILHGVRDELRRFGWERELGSGVVFTGGGALLAGLPELAEQIFDYPARMGLPLNVSSMTEEIYSPMRATAIGLLHIAARGGALHNQTAWPADAPMVARAASAVKHWFTHWF
ncbi:MAG: cell division protein FtsA [Acidobacteriota bacterium]|nr:cell division protein FtsA [Blastocatellia bacterium]MDW8238071.1 cell division protein FtsA [Acidobacteriota bacterium]